MGGNNFAAASFLVPSGTADPAERIRAMHQRVDHIRGEPALGFLGTVTPVLNRIPWDSRRNYRICRRCGNDNQLLAGNDRGPLHGGCEIRADVSSSCRCRAWFSRGHVHTCGVCCIAMNADGDVSKPPTCCGPR